MRATLTITLFSLVLLGLSPSPQTQTERQEQAIQRDPFVGNQMCLRCHEEVSEAMKGGAHELQGEDAPPAQGCQSCHGPGRAHVQSPEEQSFHPRFTGLDDEKQEAVCSGCHTSLEPVSRSHRTAQLSCTWCHSVHGGVHTTVVGTVAQGACLDCHAGDSTFDALHAHDMEGVQKGSISCSSCHRSAHGGE